MEVITYVGDRGGRKESDRANLFIVRGRNAHEKNEPNKMITREFQIKENSAPKGNGVKGGVPDGSGQLNEEEKDGTEIRNRGVHQGIQKRPVGGMDVTWNFIFV